MRDTDDRVLTTERDIDRFFEDQLRIRDIYRRALGEVKWQLSASDTRETLARDEYLKEGSEQLIRIKTFLDTNPGYLRSRRLDSRKTGR